ncbi:MAG: mechanosensitive ion channel family protein [Methanobacterium sp.]
MTLIENLFQNIPIHPLLVDVITISIILILAFVSMRIINYFLEKTGKHLELELTVIQVLEEIFKYTIIFIAVVLVLHELGIDVSAFVLSLGIVGIAVGFAARDTLSNFISGMFILGHKSFKVGDIIEVSNHVGTVTQMGFRMTTLTTQDNKIINIPNSLFSTDIYLNYTAEEKRRVELAVTIPLDIDLDKAIESMEEKISSLNWTLKLPEPKIIIQEITEVGVKATINVWIDDPWSVLKYRTELARELKQYLVQ